MWVVAGLRWLAIGVFFYWMLVYWRGGREVVTDLQNALKTGNSRLDSVLMLIILAGSLVIAVNAVLFSIMPWVGNPIVVLIGTIFTFVGVRGMFYSRSYLGRLWTAETTMQAEHRVVSTGPYGKVRHPIYAFAILMYAGLALAFALAWTIWWNIGAALAIIIAYGLKARDEDAFLERNLDGYKAYKQRVRFSLFPGLW